MSDRSSSPDDATTRSQSTSSTSANSLQGANNARKHICPQCTRAFSTSGHLARHSRVHTGQRDHACPFPGCTTRCSRQDNLQQHYRVHLSPRSRNMSTAAARAAMARAVALQQAQRLTPSQHPHPTHLVNHPFGPGATYPTPTPVLLSSGYPTSPTSPTSYSGNSYGANMLPNINGLASPTQSGQQRSYGSDVRYSFPGQEYSAEELGAGPRRGSNAGFVGEHTSRHYHPYANQRATPSNYYHAHSSSTSSTSSTGSNEDMFPPSFSSGHPRSSSSYPLNLPTTLELENPPPIRLGAEGMWAPSGNTLVSARGTWV